MKRRVLSFILVLAMVIGYVPNLARANEPDIKIEVPTETIPYREGQGAVTVLNEISMKVKVDNGEEKVLFAGGYFEVDIDDRRASETLNLPDGTYEDKDKDGNVLQKIKVENGEIFIVHSDGNEEPIGRVDSNLHGGLDGEKKPLPLKVEFSTPLENGDFNIVDDNNLPVGWQINTSSGNDYPYQIWLGNLATKTKGNSVTTTSVSGGGYKVKGIDYEFYTDFNYGNTGIGSKAGWKNEGLERKLSRNGTPVKHVLSENGQKFLEIGLKAGQINPDNTNKYTSIFGPEAISSPFNASAGDKIAFDWMAFMDPNDSSNYDDYEVYGFLVDGSNDSTEIMYGRGQIKQWTTNVYTIGKDGIYKFRFVAGSYNNTAGNRVGATLRIDNTRLFKKAVDSKVVEFIAKNITYENSNVNELAHELIGKDKGGIATRTVVIKAEDLTHAVTTQRVKTKAEVKIELNKPPKVKIPGGGGEVDDETGIITINRQTDNKTPINGSLSATDPELEGEGEIKEEDKLTYKIVDGTDEGTDKITTTNGGTATVDEDGKWTYTPGKDSDGNYFVGEDQFTIRVKDKDDGWTDVIIKINVIDNPNISVEFKKENGDPIKTELIAKGETLGNKFPIPPEKSGYDFVGWKDEEGNTIDENTPIDEDKVLYPQYTIKEYEVKFVDGENENSVTVEHGKTTNPEKPTKEGYVFKGWNTKEDGSGTRFTNSTKVTDNIELYAQWKEVDKGSDDKEIEEGGSTGGTVGPKDEEDLTYVLKENTGPDKGKATVDLKTGEWTYIPGDGKTGEDKFIIEVIKDGKVVQEIPIKIIIKDPDAVEIDKDKEKTGSVKEDNPEEGEITYQLREDSESGPGKGKATVDLETGEWTYIPRDGKTGEDEFIIEVIVDGEVVKEIPVKIIIKDPNTNVVDPEDEQPLKGTVKPNGEKTYVIGDTPKNGTATVDPETGEWKYTPEEGYTGDDKFTIVIKDKDGTVIEEITINVTVKARELSVDIEMKASPQSIVANGKDSSTLTAKVRDENGKPVAGVEVEFRTEKGTFSNGENFIKAITNKDGVATTVLTSEKIEGEEATKSYEIFVVATVSDKDRGLYGKEHIIMTFEPAYIKGVVTDNNGNPIVNTTVKVERQLKDGEKFEVTVTTDSEGKYKIAVPEEGNYEVEITRNINGQEFTFKQNAKIGEVSGIGEEKDAVETFTGVLKTLDKQGKEKVVDSETSKSIEIKGRNNNIKVEITNGVFFAEGLEKDKEYEFVIINKVKDKSGKEVELLMGKMTVKIEENGEITIHEKLIDPYGTIRDSKTKEVLEGVRVELFYANGTKVDLPILSDFAPNQNHNHQYSAKTEIWNEDVKDYANYAWMVYDNQDYYIIATKNGYTSYRSPILSIRGEVLKHSFEMTPIPKSSGGSGGAYIPSTTPKEEPKKPPVESIVPNIQTDITTNQRNYLEETKGKIDIGYINNGGLVKDVELVVTIPKGTIVVDTDGGTVVGYTIVWKLRELKSGEKGSKNPTIILPQISKAEETITLKAQIMKDGKLVGDPSEIRLTVFSNRYGNGNHRRYIQGYPDGQFKPDRQITRAEIATIFARILELEGYIKGEKIYKDVNLNDWYARGVEAASRKGLFEGFEGNFRPNDPITRAELSTVMARYLELPDKSPIKEIFGDLEGHWAANYIAELYRNNVVSGYQDGSFKPQAKLKRSEAVTMVNRILNRGPIKGVEASFPDVLLDHWANGDVEESIRSHYYYRNEDGSETHIETYFEELKF